MDLADKLANLFETEGIDYNFVVVNKLAKFIDSLIESGELATEDVEQAESIEFEVK